MDFEGAEETKGSYASGSSKQIGISNFSISNEGGMIPPAMGATALVPVSLTHSGFEATASVTGDGGSATKLFVRLTGNLGVE